MWCPESGVVYRAHFTEFNYYATRSKTALRKAFSALFQNRLFDLFVPLVAGVNRKFETSMTKCNQVRLLVTFNREWFWRINFLPLVDFRAFKRLENRKQSRKLPWTVVDLMKWCFRTLPQLHLSMHRLCHSTSMLSSNFYPFVLLLSSGLCLLMPTHSWKLLKSGCKWCRWCRASR